MSTHFTKRMYLAADAADAESCRPDFAVVLSAPSARATGGDNG